MKSDVFGILTVVSGKTDWTKFVSDLSGEDRQRLLGSEQGIEVVQCQLVKIKAAANAGDVNEVKKLLGEMLEVKKL